MLISTGLIALIFAIIHLLSGGLKFLDSLPRSRWLSMAGGVSVTYIFLHVLPELTERQEIFEKTFGEVFSFLDHHLFLLALAGLVTFYGLERAAKESRKPGPHRGGSGNTGAGVFWIHIGSFGVYNALIGYLLLRREAGDWPGLLLYGTAIGLHFMVNDHGLRQHHKEDYDKVARWILAAAPLLGWGVGIFVTVGEAAAGALFSFIAGGVILNVLKEELPEERESRIWAFVAGVVFYSILLLAMARSGE